jgi:hypothetical protein
MIGFIDTFTTTHNHNQLRYLTQNLQPNPSSLTAKYTVHSHSDLILFCTTYVVSRQAHRKHVCCVALDVLYSYVYNVVACQQKLSDYCLHMHCCGNEFTASLPSDVFTCHNMLLWH